MSRVCKRGACVVLAAVLLAGALGAQEEEDRTAVERSREIELEILDLMAQPAVVGREELLLASIERKLDRRGLSVERGPLSSVVLRFEGEEPGPARLLATPVDDPGYVVSQIGDAGYLRIVPVGQGARGALFDQFHEGQKVQVWTRSGPIYGAVAIPSTHLGRLRDEEPTRFSFRKAYLDVGAESIAEAGSLGVELMIPVTLEKRSAVLADGTVSGFGTRTRAHAVALLDTALSLDGVELSDGSLVIAFYPLESLNGKGLESVVERYGPFDEVVLTSRELGYRRSSAGSKLGLDPDRASPGDGIAEAVPGDGSDPRSLERGPTPGTGGARFGDATVRILGVPARFPDTPVETVAINDLLSLTAAVRVWLGIEERVEETTETAIEIPLEAELEPVATCQPELEQLVAAYGVSGFESPVRQTIDQMLPDWAAPSIDAAGNLVVQFGSEEERAVHEVFVAHMDEVGFVVERIQADGRLQLSLRGGLYPSLWEGQVGLVHTPGVSALDGIFEPRRNYFRATDRSPAGDLVLDIGADSKRSAERMGVIEGQSSVTMPKRMRCIGRHRAVARGFDDRVGSAALVMALGRIDPGSIEKRITFAWATEEEVGLVGSTALARSLAEQSPPVTRVYPVDTHVSSDSPLEEPRYAYSRLGGGAVLRALESINFVPREEMDRVSEIAAQRGIPLQIAMTHGGTDGQSFLAFGAPSIPLSWPGRYSHSPVEVMDLRDLESLVDLIVALIESD